MPFQAMWIRADCPGGEWLEGIQPGFSDESDWRLPRLR